MMEFFSGPFAPARLILDLMAFGVVIGAIDYARGGKWGLGKRFEEGLNTFSSLLLTMGGIIALVPLLERCVGPWLGPLCARTGTDPGIFVGMILANDMGGFQLAHALANSLEAGDLGGMLLGSIMGVNLVFIVPVALTMIEKKDREYMAKGILCGFITFPIGFLCAGLTAGYPTGFLLRQTVPVLAASLLTALFFFLIPRQVVRCFLGFGKAIGLLALCGMVCAVCVDLTGIEAGGWLDSIQGGLKVVGSIVIVLPGAYVLVALAGRIFRKSFMRLGEWMGIGETSVLGMAASMANCIPTFSMIKDMNARGKTVNFAFLAGGSFVFGDHLGFCAAVAPHLIPSMIVGKLTAAVSAVFLVLLLERKNAGVH